MNPRLGIFGSLDPFEGESSSPLTMNGYGWVEGNTPNRVDASGMSTGCQDSCHDLWNKINSLASQIAKRIEELLTDRCFLYDSDVKGLVVDKPAGCEGQSWRNHIDTLDQKKAALRKYLNCTDGNGVKRFDPASPASPQNCINSAAYTAAIIALNAPDVTMPRRHQENQANYAVEVTPMPPNSIPNHPIPEAAPEPPYPYGRGHDVPNRVEAYPAWHGAMSYAMLGVVGLACVAVGASVLSPVTGAAATTATYCTLYPQFCSRVFQR